jgi:hypothetical protein
LDLLGTIEEPSSLEMAAKGRQIFSYGWFLQKIGLPINIVLEASPGPSDLKPWIQRLLGTSRTFMVTPTKAHKSPKL